MRVEIAKEVAGGAEKMKRWTWTLRDFVVIAEALSVCCPTGRQYA